MGKFASTTALVTGASSGIGEGFARALHAQGAKVVLTARRVDRLQKITAELNALRPDSARSVPLDLTLPWQELEKAIDSIVAVEQISILVNNAGHGSFGYYDELDTAHEMSMLSVNVVASSLIAQKVLASMKKRAQKGFYISIASVAAFQPLPLMASYAATKAFNFIQAAALRAELSSFGIKVLCVCPGPTDTEFGGVARVPGTLSGTPRDSVATVINQSLAALEADRGYVVTGWKNKVLVALLGIIPLALRTALVFRVLHDVLIKAKKL